MTDMHEENIALERRVDELLNDNSAKLGENRVLNAKVRALESILQYVLIDNPVAMNIATEMGSTTGAAMRSDKNMLALYERLKVLEEAQTTKSLSIAKSFVQMVKDRYGEAFVTEGDFNKAMAAVASEAKDHEETLHYLVHTWVRLFANALE